MDTHLLEVLNLTIDYYSMLTSMADHLLKYIVKIYITNFIDSSNLYYMIITKNQSFKKKFA